MADLMESAVAAAHPDRVSRKLDNHREYYLPLNRLDGQTSASQEGIKWTEALKAAFNDGYDPILWVGRGAFSEVWRCVDRSFGREVAIKVPFHKEGINSEKIVAGLQSEAELLGRLHHPGVVHAVRRSGKGRDAYLALDFVDGEELIEHCRLQKLNGRARLGLFEKVLDAAAYLHRKGVVHGDLKPDHILVRENDQPVLIDFGLSSYDSSLSFRISDSRHIGGSGRFRAPEIANGSAASIEPQQDVYSLGVILRELVEDAEEVPDDSIVQQIIDHALLEDPDKRWRDAGEMLDVLRSDHLPNPFEDSWAGSIVPSTNNQRLQSRLRWAVSGGTIAMALITGFILFVIQPESDAASDGLGSGDSTTRQVAQASIFDLVLQDIYSGNQERAQQGIENLSTQAHDNSPAWEERFLRAMQAGRGEIHPFGLLPFAESHATCVDYDPRTETAVYVKRGPRNFELWIRPIHGPPTQFANSIEAIRAIAISPGADRVASVDIQGRVIVWKLQENGIPVFQSQELPRVADDRVLWFSADGQSLFLFSPRNRSVECWQIESPLPSGPVFVIGDCDHAYRLPSGEGRFMVATAGESTANGLTQLRVIDPKGKVIRFIELEDGLVPSSADCGPSQTSTVSLGMPNGFVRIHQTEQGGWQKPCDLGLNEAIPAIVYSEMEQRAFAALGRVHVIEHDGQLIMRLGDRNRPQELVTRLDFDNNTSILSCMSIREYWRCMVD